MRLALVLIVSFALSAPAQTNDLPARLDALRDAITAEVALALKAAPQAGNYTTIWRAHEDLAIDALCGVLTNQITSLSATSLDRGHAGHEKNRLADLAIRTGDRPIEISVKSARRSQNPENDLGTFNEYPVHKRMFGTSFTLWIRYDDRGPVITVDRVFFDRSYRFVGKSSLVNGVKYRKKDGNMRPKPWSMFEAGKSYWKSEDEFEAAVKASEKYRASSLVAEHTREMSEEDQRQLYDRLKKKFDAND